MQTYVGDIITNARSDSRNEDIPTTSEDKGISTNDLVRYANYAQRRLQHLVLKKYPRNFTATSEIDFVADQAVYSIPDNVYLGTRIVKVEVSRDGQAENYQRILPSPRHHATHTSSYPAFYDRENGGIRLEPVPDNANGKIKVRYERSLDQMALRAASISAITLSSTQLTALTLDTSDDLTDLLSTAQYLCINDKYGNVTMYNIPITSYDTGTGVVTLDAFTFASGETGTTSDYVTVGKYTTTHSDFVDEVQDYIELYLAEKAFRRDSSDDQIDLKEERKELEKAIVDAYKIADKDPMEIPVVDYEMMLQQRVDFF